MKLTTKWIVAPLLLTALGTTAAVTSPAAYAQADASGKTIVDLAVATPDLSTLVTAVKAAGLVETLSGPGPFTVFAPTNAAFAKIPPAQLKALLADKAALTKILTYHVISGEVPASVVTGLPYKAYKTTVSGDKFLISPSPTMINNAKIIKTDIMASNGVIHLIDTVIMPGKMDTVSKMKMGKMNKMGGM